MQSKQIEVGTTYAYSQSNEWRDYRPRTYHGGSPVIVLDERVWIPASYNYVSKKRTSRKSTMTSQKSEWLVLLEVWGTATEKPHATVEEARAWAVKFHAPQPGDFDLANVNAPHGWILSTAASREIRTEWDPYIAEKIVEAKEAKIAQARYAVIQAERDAIKAGKEAVVNEAVAYLTAHGYEVATGYADKYHTEPAMIVSPDVAIRIVDALRPALD